MRSPSEMTIIQIELTNACIHGCSNCTRLCGHHKKPFFIGWDDFKRAVKSLEGFQGMAGLMGGEPTLHPEFDRFARHLAENFGVKETLPRGREPISDFSSYASTNLLKIKPRGRCLCSSTGPGYYKHFEVIQETFHYQLLNDHQHSGLHQGILVSRKDAGIPDEEWHAIRDACWLQNNWSASITPKGAFFCEVAATLDMLFDGPGGWPVEPGWWKRTPQEFGDQLKWCELCGIAFSGPKTEAREEKDDVSPTLLKMLEKTGSPRFKAGKWKLYSGRCETAGKSEYTPGKPFYLPDGDSRERIRNGNLKLAPKSLAGIMLCDNPHGLDPESLAKTAGGFDNLILACFKDAAKAPKLAGTTSMDAANLGFGEMLQKAMELAGAKDWVALIGQNSALAGKWKERIRETVFNPGCMFVYGGNGSWPETAHEPLVSLRQPLSSERNFLLCMFNAMASSFKAMDLKSAKTFDDFTLLWQKDKLTRFDNSFDALKPRPPAPSGGKPGPSPAQVKNALMKEHVLSSWELLSQAYGSIGLYGAGAHTAWLLKELGKAGAKLPSVIFDDKPQASQIEGVQVLKPEGKPGVDVIVVSSDAHALEMFKRAQSIWKEGVRIVNMYGAFKNPVFSK